MWRVSGLRLSWLRTVQPSMSGRNTSSETAVGLYLAASDERIRSGFGHQHLESPVAGEVEQHPAVVRIVLHDEQHWIAFGSRLSRSSAMSSVRTTGSTTGWYGVTAVCEPPPTVLLGALL